MTGNRILTHEKILEIARSLPPAPQVMSGLGELLRDVNVDLDRVADLIRRDASLAAHLIRISNSVVHAREDAQRIGSVEEAVHRLGYREIYQLAGMAAMTRLTDRMLVHYEVPILSLRANMLHTALVCEALAVPCGLDAGRAYTVGLLRTLGMMVLDRIADLLSGVPHYDQGRFEGYSNWEGRTFLFGNCEVAGMILDEWGFPSSMVEAVRGHHLDRESDYSNRLSCLLNVSGGLVAEAGNGLPGEAALWENAAPKLAALHLGKTQAAQIAERTLEDFARLCPLLGIQPPVPKVRTQSRPVVALEEAEMEMAVEDHHASSWWLAPLKRLRFGFH